jgi:hypothetical protein
MGIIGIWPLCCKEHRLTTHHLIPRRFATTFNMTDEELEQFTIEICRYCHSEVDNIPRRKKRKQNPIPIQIYGEGILYPRKVN